MTSHATCLVVSSFPGLWPGIVKLDRNEYAALTELARADGDVSKVAAIKYVVTTASCSTG